MPLLESKTRWKIRQQATSHFQYEKLILYRWRAKFSFNQNINENFTNCHETWLSDTKGHFRLFLWSNNTVSVLHCIRVFFRIHVYKTGFFFFSTQSKQSVGINSDTNTDTAGIRSIDVLVSMCLLLKSVLLKLAKNVHTLAAYIGYMKARKNIITPTRNFNNFHHI